MAKMAQARRAVESLEAAREAYAALAARIETLEAEVEQLKTNAHTHRK